MVAREKSFLDEIQWTKRRRDKLHLMKWLPLAMKRVEVLKQPFCLQTKISNLNQNALFSNLRSCPRVLERPQLEKVISDFAINL